MSCRRIPRSGRAGRPAPLVLQFSDSGGGGTIATSFASLSPALNQTFFVGDGLTGNGTGAVQQFDVPVGASRLFLGIPDGPTFGSDPGSYGDNSGAFSATYAVTPVPEPSSLLLVGYGMAGMAATYRRRRKVNRLT